jgi:type I restriction enzyme M protein
MNPPFGGVEEDGTDSNFPTKFRTKETADLFLALIIKMLKDGGRAAVVLPDGTLFGEGVKTRIKEELMEKCNLHTIVRLPNGVFNPYTGIKTNLLFFDKGTPTKEVWYYEHPYPQGYKSYNKSKPISVHEFEVEKAWWNKREENQYAWKVSAEEIKARGYNLDIKNPHQEADNLASPEEILKQYRATESKISSIQDEIVNVLTEALS